MCIRDRSDSGRADSMVYHGDTAFGEDIHNAGAQEAGAWDLKKE